MKGIRLVAVSLMILLIFACFISVPVFGENPWDADNGDGSESQADTTGSNDDGTLQQQQLIAENNPYPDWLTGALFQLSYQFFFYVFDSQPEPATPQVAAE
jgi:hypothetical protein